MSTAPVCNGGADASSVQNLTADQCPKVAVPLSVRSPDRMFRKHVPRASQRPSRFASRRPFPSVAAESARTNALGVRASVHPLGHSQVSCCLPRVAPCPALVANLVTLNRRGLPDQRLTLLLIMSLRAAMNSPVAPALAGLVSPATSKDRFTLTDILSRLYISLVVADTLARAWRS
jgi:hypothetical protein